MLYFSEQEYEGARADYERAKEAGANVDMVQWLSKEETLKVVTLMLSIKSELLIQSLLPTILEIWCAIPGCLDSWQ